MKYDIPAALQALKPGAEWVLRGDQHSGLEWLDKSQLQPTEKEINDKIAELDAAEGMRLLRVERDAKLAALDWEVVKAYSIIANGGYYIKPTLIRTDKKIKTEKVLDENISIKILPILRKIVSTKEGTAQLADIYGYDIGGKTGTANKSLKGVYSNEKVNTFVSVFPTTKPKFILAVMLDAPKINSDYIYNYRDGSNFKLKGSPRNTAGWNSVEAAGHIIEKIGPILATKYSEIN